MKEKGYCHICGQDEVELEFKDSKIWPGRGDEEGNLFNMCVWCANLGAFDPLPINHDRNQRMGELSRGLRYFHSLLSSK